ncbi:MAG: chitinase, partial [Hydrogenovibrio sp.]
MCRKSLANMFAHFAQETGGHAAESVLGVPEWRQALMYVREMGYTEQVRGAYAGECNPDTWQGQAWPCGTFDDGEFKSYFGRGAKQLSYNYNYGPFSQAMTGNVRTLLDNPELVADTWLNFASAVFFFTYPQTPKPSMLHILDGTWQPNAKDEANNRLPGFGVTTMVMNGGVECGGTVEHQQSANRIRYYQRFADYFGVPIPADEVLGCANMAFFDGEGSAAMNTYWDQDWGYDASKPGGQSYA